MKKARKYGLLVLLSANTVLAAGIEVGATREQVIARLGEPRGRMQRGERETLLYADGSIVLEQGRVISQAQAPAAHRPAPAESATAGPGSRKRLFERLYEAIAPQLIPGTMTAIPLSELPGVDTASFRLNERWIVSVIFLNGVAEVLSYSAFNEHRWARRIEADEFDALLKKHAGGMEWRRQRTADATQYFFGALVNPHGTYVRDDGVLAFTHVNQMRIETPAFREAVSLAEQRREQQRIQHIPVR